MMDRLKQTAIFYREFATLIRSGIDLGRALTVLQSQAKEPRLRKSVSQIANDVTLGQSLSESLSQHANFMSSFEKEMLAFAEASGQFDRILTHLAEWAEFRLKLAQELRSHLTYPVILLHLGIFLPPLPLLFSQNVGAYLQPVLTSLVLLYGLGAVVYVLIKMIQNQPVLAERLSQMVLEIPIVGGLIRDLALARFFFAMTIAIESGIPIADALALSGRACGNAYIAQQVLKDVPAIRRGSIPDRIFRQKAIFPGMVYEMWRTGQESGSTEDMMHHLSRHFREASSRNIKSFFVWLPRLIYVLILLYIVYQIFSMAGPLLGPVIPE